MYTKTTWLASVLARVGILGAIVTLMAGAAAAAPSGAPGLELPAWVKEAGAQRAPAGEKVYAVKTYGAVNDGKTLATAAIQQAIDTCSAAGGGVVDFEPGTYLTGALFVKSGVDLRIDAGVTLLGVQDETAYPKLATRVAGIEMEWPAALINVNDQQNVKISGAGAIDGNGELWWNKYWIMRRQDYEPRGLRWAVDYDCERVRLLVVWKSSDVTVAGLRLRRAGFWTVQVCYSDRVTVDGINIRDNGGPSTDGVDVDSSSHVLVQNCDIDNNDDCICLKSGRDADGMRVNRPAEYVVIRHNTTRHGGGIVSFGSETSGGIRHVVAYDNTGIGTSEGLRFKSARTRGGTIEDVLVRDIKMENVPSAFSFTLNWNPGYSYVTLPKDATNLPPNLKGIPAHWKIMALPVEPPEKGFADFHDITIANVEVIGARRILSASGLPGKLLGDVRWENITAYGRQAGAIEYARDWTMKNVRFVTEDGVPVSVTNSENVAAPAVAKAEPAPAAKP
jgi:hypothetical protein